MNDKLQQLYDLYKSNGLITIDFNTFASANDNQKKGLYDLGVQRGLFSTTPYETFNSAFSGGQDQQQPEQQQQQQQQPQYNKLSYQAIPEQPAAPTLGQQVQDNMEQIMPGLQQKRESNEQAKRDAERNALLGAMKKADEAKDYVKKKAAQDAALQEMGLGQDTGTVSVSEDGSSELHELPRMPKPGELSNIGAKSPNAPYEFSGKNIKPVTLEQLNKSVVNQYNREHGLPYEKSSDELLEEGTAALKKQEEEQANEAAKKTSALNKAINALPAFNSLLNSIDAELIGKEEEDIIDQLDFKFGRFGFTFSESGAGDNITVRTADGLNGIEIKLDNWSDAQDFSESERLKEFIKEFSRMPKSIELAKKQENLSPVELEADAFYSRRGLNYFEEQDKWDTYTRLRDEIEFIKEDMAGEKTLEEEKMYPNLYVNGELRTDIEERLGKLERQRDGLFESVFDAGFLNDAKVQKTREDFDVHLNKLSEAQAKQAADLNTIAQTKEFEIQTTAFEKFGVPAKDLFNLTPKSEQEAVELKSLQDAYYSSQVEKDFAARKYDMAKTYFDGKINKEVRGEYTENWDAFVAQAQSGYANGKAAEQILAISMGLKDVNDPKERAKAIAIIVENMRRAEELSNKQSRVLDRTNSSVGWKEWSSAVAADPFEWATSLAAHSISEMLPYGSKIVPTTVAAGAGAGAAIGSAAGGVGALPGAITGAGYGLKTGMAASGFAMEYTNAIFDAMRSRGYDLTDPTQVEMAMADQEVWSEGGKIGVLRGIPIASMDLLSAGLAGRVFKVSKLAALPTKIAVGTAERMVFDPFAEAAGETLAQISAGQKLDWKEIAAEAGGAIGNNSSNMAINMYRDARNSTNIKFADNLTKIGFLSSETASDSRISSWANNMQTLGKIDADVNQRIQENVGLRRDARDILGIGKFGSWINKSPETVNRVMELLAARQELSSTTNRRELNRSKITAINDEITAISETRALLPQEQSVDLSLIIGTTRRGTSQYIIDGKRLTKDEFNYRLGKMSPEKVAKLDAAGKIIIRQDTDAMAAVADAISGRGSRINTPDEEKLTQTELDRKAELEEALATRAEDEKKGITSYEVTDGKGGVTKFSYADAQAELDALNEKAKAKPKPAEVTTETTPTVETKPAEVTTEEVVTPTARLTEPTAEEKLADIQKGNLVTFKYENDEQVPEEMRQYISSRGETNGVKEVRVTIPKVLADYLIQEKTTPAPAAEVTTETEAATTTAATVEVTPEMQSKIDEIERKKQEALESEKYRIVESSELYQDNEGNYYKIQKLANGKTKVVFADENGVTQAQMGEYNPEVSLDTIFNGDENIYGSRKGDSRLTLTKIKDLKFTNKIVDKINAKYDAEIASLKSTPAPTVAPQVTPTVAPAVAPAPTTQAETKKGMTREEIRAKEKEVAEENKKAKENAGKNINVKDYKKTKKRGQDLKVGDVYVRRFGDTLFVYKVLSKLTKYTGQFYTMNVEILHVGNHANRKEVGPDGEVREDSRRVGNKTIDTFKNMISGSGKFNFGEVTVLENFEQAPEAKTEVAPAPAVETTPAPTTTTEVAPTTKAAPTKTKAEQQLEEDMVQAQAEIDNANEKIAEIQEEIAIEKSNTKDKVVETKEKIAKIRATVTNKTTQKRLIQELKDELENFRESQENQIEIYNEDLAEQRAALRKAEAKLKRLEAKKAEIAPAPKAEEKTETQQAPAKRGYISIAEIRQRFPLAAAFLELQYGPKQDNHFVSPKVSQGLLSRAYRVMPRSKKAAIEFLEVLKQVEDLAEQFDSDVKKVTKAQFKKQLAESGDFNAKQLRILNALVDSLQTDVMPEYIVTEGERKAFGDNSKNFFSNMVNKIIARDAEAFIHEIGHFSFYRILTGKDRIKYFEYMIESTYGKKGVPLKERLVYSSSRVWGVGPEGQQWTGTSNVADQFSEYFAEQFSQWYMGERLFPADIDTLFEKIAQFYNLVIEKLKSGKYVDKNLTEYFNKISAKVEQKRAVNKKNNKQATPEPELSESVQELEDNLGLDFEDEFGLDDELSPMNRNFDTPLVKMAKMYNMKESGFFQNNVSTSHVNRDFYQFGLESKQSAAGTYYLVDINTKKMVNPFKTKRGGSNNTDNMAKKIVDINKKRKTAKDNVKSKIGVAQSLAPGLNRLFSVNPRIIPDVVFDKYMALLEGFTGRAKVLTPPEINAATANMQAVLAALDADVSQVESLAIRMDNYTNKVFDSNGNLDFDATITNMKNDGTLTEAEYKLIKKHKKRIMPKVSKPKMTAAEEKVIKDQLIQDIKSLVIRISGLATRFERNAAKEFENLLTDEILEKLSISRLSNILKLIDNINNGYFPNYAQLTINRLQGIKEAVNLSESIRKVDPLRVSKFISSVKAKLSSSEALYEMIKRIPTFYLDQAFGDFKSKTIYNAVFQPLASAYSSFKTSIDRINDKLDKSRDRVAKSFGYNNNKILESSFKMMTYMIQNEFESNPGNKQVNPAAEYINATINKRNSIYGEAEVKMLQDILNKYGVVIGQDKNGNDIIGIDNQALYASFNKEEKAALKTIRDINDGMTEMAQYTASVIRGQSIDPLNNYVHLRVMTDMDPESAASATIIQNTYNNSLRPSTKAKNLEERTVGAKAINFDVFASAQAGAKSTLLDFHMTDPIRTVRGTLSETARMLEQGPKLTAEQKEAFSAVEKIFEEVLRNVLTKSFSVDSFWDMVGSEITKQGYRAVLASTSKFAAELLSNLSYAIWHPQEFTAGLAYIKTLRSASAADIMMNVDSSVTSRVYSGETLSGRLIDTSAMTQSSGIKSGTVLSPTRNVANMIYNASLKKYKNSVEIIADTLISSPDKLVMRPVWFGAFANEFKKQSGVDVDFDKIAANDEAYMIDHAETITAAREFADEQAVLMGATNNPFMAITRGSATHDMGFWAKFYHNFNNYMTTFRVFEFNAVRQGIYAAVGNGTMSKARGAALAAACVSRMTSYNLLMSMFAGGLVGAAATWAGVKKKDDDDDKTIGQKAAQSTISSILGLMVGRDFGNATTTIFNYQMEKANKNYFDFLRKEVVDPKTGEVSYPYDPYKDGIAYSLVPGEDDPTDFGQMLVSLTGSTSPMFKTAKLAFEKWHEDPKKEHAAIERQNAEIKQRIPLEIVGNAGYIPLYKEFKSLLNDLIYESLKDEQKKEEIKAKEAAREKKRLGIYESREDMERYDPVLYEKTFGPSSPDYAEDEAKRKAAKGLSEWKRSEKDKKYGYDPNKIPTKYEMSRSELKRYFPDDYDRKYGKDSPTYAEDEAEKAVTKYEKEQRQKQLDAYYGYKSKPTNPIREQIQKQKDKIRGQFDEMRANMRRGL